jgi:hypothetical protein
VVEVSEMKPKIEGARFGSIDIGGRSYDHDVVIRLNGKVKKRKKKLSKERYGTSHKVSLEEARQVYQEGAERLIVGSGKFGLVKLSKEAAAYLAERGCQVDRLRTRKAIAAWNKAQGAVIALFHVTC